MSKSGAGVVSQKQDIEQFETLRQKIKNGEGHVLHTSLPINGTSAAAFVHFDLPFATGVVQYNHEADGSVAVLHSFVHHALRRCGVRTRIHEEMLDWYPGATFVSAQGSPSGAAWMRSMGYVYDEDREIWILRR
jgi:hypothetical protein